VLAIEELSLSGWPALQTVAYDGWLLRFAEGYTKRSNSVNLLYPSAIPVEEKIPVCEGLYGERGLPTIFKILDSEEPRTIDAELERRGYSVLDETSVQTLDLSAYAAFVNGGIDRRTEIRTDFDGAWIDGFCGCSGAEGRKDTIARILRNVIPKKVAASVSLGSETVACGYGAVDRGSVGLFDIVVKEGMRGQGLGKRIVAAILEAAKAMGAKRACLQVVAENAPAVSLYKKMGFLELYRYWYRRK
jgi:GNAT superfamily N-acetyltransferase